MKQARETKAGKAISAWVVMKRHRHIATIQAHCSDSGVVAVDIFNHGKNRSAEKLPHQQGHASGWGYDKLTTALNGMQIDGHTLCDNCGDNRRPKGGGLWPRNAVAPKGWHFANWTSQKWVGESRVDLADAEKGWSDCYREPGLKYLEALGYQVIAAI